MAKDNTLNVLEESEEKVARFFNAWRRGVLYIGPELFGPKTPETAKVKEDLTPQQEAVEKAFVRESGGERQFLGAMVSFFDPAWGEELTARTDDEKSVCGLTYNLDHESTEILCELLRNYCGW